MEPISKLNQSGQSRNKYPDNSIDTCVTRYSIFGNHSTFNWGEGAFEDMVNDLNKHTQEYSNVQESFKTPEDEDDDQIHFRIKSEGGDEMDDSSLHDSHFEIEVKPAWLQKELWNINPTKEKVTNQNLIEVEHLHFNSEFRLNKKLYTQVQSKSSLSIEMPDVDLSDWESARWNNHPNSDIESLTSSFCANDSDGAKFILYQNIDESTLNSKIEKKKKEAEWNFRDPYAKFSESWLLTAKNIDDINKRDESTKNKNEFQNFKPEGTKTQSESKPRIRQRTKLSTSGESSSSKPMDLSKRRDVINKTILRMIRRFFTQTYKSEIEGKYQNTEEIVKG